MKKLLLILLLLFPVLAMAQLELPYSVKNLNPRPLDFYYYNNAGAPYTNTAQVISQISSSVRYQGMTVNVAGVEYHFKDGIADGQLVVKTSDLTGLYWLTSGTTITTADVTIQATNHNILFQRNTVTPVAGDLFDAYPSLSVSYFFDGGNSDALTVTVTNNLPNGIRIYVLGEFFSSIVWGYTDVVGSGPVDDGGYAFSSILPLLSDSYFLIVPINALDGNYASMQYNPVPGSPTLMNPTQPLSFFNSLNLPDFPLPDIFGSSSSIDYSIAGSHEFNGNVYMYNDLNVLGALNGVSANLSNDLYVGTGIYVSDFLLMNGEDQFVIKKNGGGGYLAMGFESELISTNEERLNIYSGTSGGDVGHIRLSTQGGSIELNAGSDVFISSIIAPSGQTYMVTVDDTGALGSQVISAGASYTFQNGLTETAGNVVIGGTVATKIILDGSTVNPAHDVLEVVTQSGRNFSIGPNGFLATNFSDFLTITENLITGANGLDISSVYGSVALTALTAGSYINVANDITIDANNDLNIASSKVNITNGSGTEYSRFDDVNWINYNGSTSTTIGFTNTSNRTINFPNASGTIALLSDLGSFLTGTLTGSVDVNTNASHGFRVGNLSGASASQFEMGVNPSTTYMEGGGGLVRLEIGPTDSNNAARFIDTRTTKVGLRYAASGYVTDARSLADKGYVDANLIGKTLPAAPTASEDGQALRWNNVGNIWEYFTPGSGGGVTNLAFAPSSTTGTVTSDTGTDAIIPLGNGTNSGLSLNDYTTAEKNKLAAITGTNSGDVALAGTPDYITISGQTITRGLIDLATDVTGDLPFSNIAQVGTATFTGRNTAGTGDLETLSIATAKTMLNLAGTNLGDQTTIVGITGTKAQYNTSLTDGDFLYVGDAPTAHTLDSHSNVTITSNTSGELLAWNGSAWINRTLAEAGIQPAGSYLTGNQTITLSGDVSGSGATAITTTIANDAVTFAKFQNITDNRLLGRSAGSDGDMQHITIGSGLTLSGGTLSATGGGGGITNSAANNELMKSNGTNAVPSGVWSLTSGNVTLGDNSLAGNRTLSILSSDVNANLTLEGKGNVIIKPDGSATTFTFSSSGISQSSGAALNLSTTGNLNLLGAGSANLGHWTTPASGSSNTSITTVGTTYTTNGVSGDLKLRTGNSVGSGASGNVIIFPGTGTTLGNIAIGVETVSSWQSMQRGIFFADVVNAPTGNPTDGSFFWVDAATHLPKWRVPGGTVYTLTDTGGGGGGTPATYIGIENNVLRYEVVPSSPATPASGGFNTYAKEYAGRPRLFVNSSTGNSETPFQRHNGHNRFVHWSPAGNSTTITATGAPALTATGTATAHTTAVTNFYTRQRGLEYLVTTAATTAVAGFRGSANQFWFGTVAASGGFDMICRWGPSTGVATATNRAFVGFSTGTGAPTDVNPSTLTNMFGMGWDASDTNIQFMHNDGSGTATKIDLGVNFPRPTTDRTDAYEIGLYTAPNSSTVYYEIMNMTTGNIIAGSVNTDLPNTNTLFSPRGWMSVGGTSSVIGIKLMNLYIETDY